MKSMYKVMDQSLSVFFPHLSIWNPYVPNRVGFFAWEAFWGKVLTLEKLKRWRRVLANKCFLCEEEEETVDHLLLCCTRARILWELFISIVGISWVPPT